MKHHAAFGLAMEDIDAVVVEDSKPMQTILRSILLSFKVSRVRVFDSVDEALEASLAEPPNVILTDWRMAPTSGYQFLRLVRHRHMEPLCYVPILFITAHGTRPLVDKALRAGAHHVLVKPVSPSTLFKRLHWLLNDDRPMILEHSGFYNIYGIQKTMDEQAEKMQSLAGARLHHRTAVKKRAEVEDAVEEAFEKKEEPKPIFAGVKKRAVSKDKDIKKKFSAAAKHIRTAGFTGLKGFKPH
ncbi:response regulator [Roseibium porphyridii]|uniref:Response regulator n=1 Tax=Roseibium porphyridii TaxID=2866279 RepID=A0ABY8EWL6_9HYPH|nr:MULTISPECIES: response regulator [Stappiaceae]QFT31936.1 Chemotaxis protein CheY [Labrenzia sp. THAF82]WFE87327.1 response regulator [Roseibium sp. KMA01]